MNRKLSSAIRNNNGLYEAVFRASKTGFERNKGIWYSLEQTPPLYSNLVTLTEAWEPDDILRQIDANGEREAWDQWSVKDSFAVLNLGQHGFEKLFDAEWFYLSHANFAPVAGGNLKFKIAVGEDDLTAWIAAWGEGMKIGNKIFRTEMLNDENVFFISGCSEGGLASGCLVNRTGDVLGISNCFAPGEDRSYWPDLLNFIFNVVAPLDVVGYHRKPFVDELQKMGFETIGDLSVWLKKSG